MALYGRKQFEEEMEVIESARHMLRTSLLKRKLDGLEFNQWMRKLDEEERRCKGGLNATRMILSQKKGGTFSAGKADTEYRAMQESRMNSMREAIKRQQEHHGQVKKEADRMGKKGM